jgi:hypothetical protein
MSGSQRQSTRVFASLTFLKTKLLSLLKAACRKAKMSLLMAVNGTA